MISVVIVCLIFFLVFFAGWVGNLMVSNRISKRNGWLILLVVYILVLFSVLKVNYEFSPPAIGLHIHGNLEFSISQTDEYIELTVTEENIMYSGPRGEEKLDLKIAELYYELWEGYPKYKWVNGTLNVTSGVHLSSGQLSEIMGDNGNISFHDVDNNGILSVNDKFIVSKGLCEAYKTYYLFVEFLNGDMIGMGKWKVE